MLPASWRWAVVDLGPVIDELDFLRLILHALGSDQVGGPAALRAALWEILAEGADDGRQWGLIVEEGQNASPGVLEELRILGNRMGEPGAFAGLILVGQNVLARRMTTRTLASLQSRISAWVHLRPLDVNELHAWVDRLEPGRGWDVEAVERLHRDLDGNPRRVLAVMGRSKVVQPAEPGPRPALTPRAVTVAKPEPAASVRIPDCETPPVAPGKPPLHVGEGMIEVGWEPTAEPDPEFDSGRGVLARAANSFSSGVKATTTRDPDGPGKVETTEVIDDHYAALQAWTEWAQNQGRQPVTLPPVAEEGPDAMANASADREQENPSARFAALAGVRAEGQHEFAPYSQLFSRLRQPRDNA